MKPSILLLAPMLLPLLAALPGQARAEPAELRFVVKSEELPAPNAAAVQRFQELLGGALAHQLGRKVRFIGLPRKRMAAALAAGEGDILCGYTPEWMPGALEWSHPFIPVGDVLLSSPGVPAPARIEELKGKRIGTVLGFTYPDMERKLGAEFVREDAPSAPLALRKWQLGRTRYVLAPRATVDKMIATGGMPSGAHLLPVNEIRTMCAVPQHGAISLKELNGAIDALEKNGEMARMLKAR